MFLHKLLHDTGMDLGRYELMVDVWRKEGMY